MKLVIIQSLFPEDRETGVNLYTHLTSSFSTKDIELKRVSTMKNWQDSLNYIKGLCCQSNKEAIFVHLEIHGAADKTGLVLCIDGTGEKITWTSIADEFASYNRSCGYKLHISLGVCHGLYWALDTISIQKLMPFRYMIGSLEVLHDLDLQQRYRVFYTSLFSRDTLYNALNKMQQVPGANEGSKYSLIDPVFVFYKSWCKYKAEKIDDPDAVHLMSLEHAREYSLSEPQRQQYVIDFTNNIEQYCEKMYLEFKVIFFDLKKSPTNENSFNVPKTLGELYSRFN